MNEQARERTIAQAEADAQAMAGELERLVEALRVAREEAGIATVETPTAPGAELAAWPQPSQPAPQYPPTPDLPSPWPQTSEPASQWPPTPDLAPELSSAATPPLWPPTPSPSARPRRPLTSALGLAAVAVVGMVGAAVVTVARDSSASTGGGNGMAPIPYAQTASTASASAHAATALPLGSAAAAAGAEAAKPDAAANPTAATSSFWTEGGHWHHPHGEHAAPGYPSTVEGQELLARALKQAEEAEAQELQALAQSTSSPTSNIPRLPPYSGQHRRR